MIKQSETFHNRVYIGAHGNLSFEEAKLTASSASVADVFQVLDVPVGIKVTGIRLFTDGLGAGVTVDVAVGGNSLITGEDVAAATAVTKAVKPAYISERAPLEVTIGGAEATGELVVALEYVNVGY